MKPLRVLLLLLLLTTGFCASPVGAVHAVELDIGVRVIDAAGLFTAKQAAALDEKARELIGRHMHDLVVATTSDAGGKSAMAYADDFYDHNGYGIGPDYDGLLLLIDMDNREIFITTTGSAIKRFNDAQISRMLDNIYDYVAKGDYAGGANIFLRDVDRHLSKAKEVHYWSWEFFGIGLFAVFMFMSAMVVNHKKGLLAIPSAGAYINKEGCDLADKRDVFLHSSTRRIAINNDSSGSGRSGGSSTRTSSSGRTHGGGGRRF